MKYLPLIWAGLRRKPLRTTLSFLAVIAAFLLFGILQGIGALFGHFVSDSHIDRLYVMSKLNNDGDIPLPISHLARIQTLPGIVSVTPINGIGGYYQDPKNFVPAWAVDPESVFDVFSELKIPADQLAIWRKNRATAVVGATLAAKYGWKIGDRVPLVSGMQQWSFDIVGIFDDPGSGSALNLANRMMVHYALIDETLPARRGTTNLVAARIADPKAGPRVAAAIDKDFANSTDETETSSEKDFVASLLAQLGNVQSSMTHLTLAVFFTLLLLIGNTVAQSVRERTSEIGVLKTIGFSDAAALCMILAETLLLILSGAAVALAIVWFAYPHVMSLINNRGQSLQPEVLVWGLAAAVALALAAALLPARRAGRLTIVDALSRQ
jgi:putative ABC transport system permease protein